MTEIWTIYFASRKLSQHPEKKHVRTYGSVSFLLRKYILNIILFLYPNPPQTRQTLATGVGFLGVGICQLGNTTGLRTRRGCDCGFPWVRVWVGSREYHGFTYPSWVAGRVRGVGVRVRKFVPSPYPYPWDGYMGFDGFFPRVFPIWIGQRGVTALPK